MSTPIIRGQFAELLGRGGVAMEMMNKFAEKPVEYTSLVKVLTSTRAYEEDFQMTGFGPLAPMDELEPAMMDRPYQLGLQRYIHQKYGLGFGVSREMLDDDQYGVIRNLAGELGKSSRWTLELYGADVYNNGFAGTKYIGRDGKNLFATDHPIKGISGLTIANRPFSSTQALSFSALEAAIQQFARQLNDRGMPIQVTPQYLHVSPEEEMNARRLLQSTGSPGNNFNDINTIAGKLQIVVHTYLADNNAWFLTAAPSELDVKMYMRMQPTTYMWDDDAIMGAFTSIVQRHSTGFGDWRGTWGSPGL
jgi:phage major head subunit gpT-like protein